MTSFLDLPLELRWRIYKRCLPQSRKIPLPFQKVTHRVRLREGESYTRPFLPLDTSIFLVNKLVYHDACRYFFGENTFCLTMSPAHLERSFKTIGPLSASYIRRIRLDMRIDTVNPSEIRASILLIKQHCPCILSVKVRVGLGTGFFYGVAINKHDGTLKQFMDCFTLDTVTDTNTQLRAVMPTADISYNLPFNEKEDEHGYDIWDHILWRAWNAIHSLIDGEPNPCKRKHSCNCPHSEMRKLAYKRLHFLPPRYGSAGGLED